MTSGPARRRPSRSSPRGPCRPARDPAHEATSAQAHGPSQGPGCRAGDRRRDDPIRFAESVADQFSHPAWITNPPVRHTDQRAAGRDPAVQSCRSRIASSSWRMRDIINKLQHRPFTYSTMISIRPDPSTLHTRSESCPYSPTPPSSAIYRPSEFTAMPDTEYSEVSAAGFPSSRV